MTINDLRETAAQFGIAHAEFCLEQHTTQIGRVAADPLWLELSILVTEYADQHDGLDDLPDVDMWALSARQRETRAMNKLDLAIAAIETGMPNSQWRAETLKTLQDAKAAIEGLLDAAQHGADDFLSLANECAEDDEMDASENYAERAERADQALSAARALLDEEN